MGDNYESFYKGGYSSLSPDYGNFIGYRMPATNLGYPGSGQTANQLQETSNAIKQGVKAFEVTMISPETGEQIPKEHFEEMRALMKLTGVKPSVHGPLIDAAGFGEKGTWGGDFEKENNENRMFQVIEKAQVLDPRGNTPVVFHAGVASPSATWKKDKEGKWLEHRIPIINLESKQLTIVEEDHLIRPGADKKYMPIIEGPISEQVGTPFTAEDKIFSANESEWDNSMTNLAMYNKHATEMIGSSAQIIAPFQGLAEDTKALKEAKKHMTQDQLGALSNLKDADIFLSNVRLSFSSAFEKAFRYGTKEQRQQLKKLGNDYEKEMKYLRGSPMITAPLVKQKVLDDAIGKLKKSSYI